MFSATWPNVIRKLASEFLSNPARVIIGSQDLAASHSVKQVRVPPPWGRGSGSCSLDARGDSACAGCVASQPPCCPVQAVRSCSSQPCTVLATQGSRSLTGQSPVSEHASPLVHAIPHPHPTLPTTQIVEVIDAPARDARLHALLQQYHGSRTNRVIVFVLYKKEASRVESLLLRKGWKAAAVHGDISQAQRSAAVDAFKAGTVPVLVATDVAARGLDIPDVEVVINYSFPLTTEDYVHRIGRTGRAGKKGELGGEGGRWRPGGERSAESWSSSVRDPTGPRRSPAPRPSAETRVAPCSRPSLECPRAQDWRTRCSWGPTTSRGQGS